MFGNVAKIATTARRKGEKINTYFFNIFFFFKKKISTQKEVEKVKAERPS